MELILKPKGKGMKVVIGDWLLDGQTVFFLAEKLDAYVDGEKVELPIEQDMFMREISSEEHTYYHFLQAYNEGEFEWDVDNEYSWMSYEIDSLDDVKLLKSSHYKTRYNLGEFEHFPIMMIANYIKNGDDFEITDTDTDW